VPSKTTFAISGIARRGSTRLFKRRDDCVSAALERIWRPGGAKLTPREILAAFPCSRRSAEIRFRQATGHAVLDELQKARIHQAKQLLANTNLPVSAVAENCGYASLAHFRDTFRKETGANPLTWRKSHRDARGQERVPVAELK
jgi:transcriptional regulator GlxA family with amidase domain